MQIPSCGFHCAGSMCRFYRAADSIVRIPSCRFVQISLCGFLHAHSIFSSERIPSSAFHQRHSNIVRMRIPSCGFHRADSIAWIPLCRFYHAHSIMCIPSCAFHCMHSIVCIPSCNRRRKEEVKEDGGWVHWRIVFTFVVGINRDATTESVLSESPSTGSASTRLYRSHCMCVVDY